MAKKIKRLYRSEKDVIVGGVCGGIAEYFEVDPVLIRAIAIVLAIMAFSGVIAYLILWIIMPTKSEAMAGLKSTKKQNKKS